MLVVVLDASVVLVDVLDDVLDVLVDVLVLVVVVSGGLWQVSFTTVVLLVPKYGPEAVEEIVISPTVLSVRSLIETNATCGRSAPYPPTRE